VRKKLDWQKRALILLGAIILILSVILTVFAIREAEREKLLKQREINEEQQRSADTIIDQVKEYISKTEERIIRLLGQSRDRSDENRLTEAAISIDENEPLVSEIFYVVDNAQIHFPLINAE
jgi:predicted Holliday junction resolvase-like endonuclease